jgi:hypothetical protein
MKLTLSERGGFIRLTDAEAEVLVEALQRQLARRKDLIASEPQMATWNDVVGSFTAECNGKTANCAFGICAS